MLSGYRDCAVKQQSMGSSSGDIEETRRRAMNDPEVQQIMGVCSYRVFGGQCFS